MAILIRNARWLSLMGISVIAIGVYCVLWVTRVPLAQAQTVYNALDPVTAARIAELRRENGYDNDALASVDLSDTQLESVLAALRTWYEANAPDLLTQRSALADQRALIRRYQSQVDQGQDQASALAAARAELVSLQTEYASLLASSRQSCEASLSETVRTQLAALRGRTEVPMPYRVLALTPQQLSDLGQTLLRFQQRLSVARDVETQSTIRGLFDQELLAAIGSNHVQTVQSLGAALANASQRVVTVVERVLRVAAPG